MPEYFQLLKFAKKAQLNKVEQALLAKSQASVEAAFDRYVGLSPLEMENEELAVREFSKLIGAYTEGNIIAYEAVHVGGPFCQGRT